MDAEISAAPDEVDGQQGDPDCEAPFVRLTNLCYAFQIISDSNSWNSGGARQGWIGKEVRVAERIPRLVWQRLLLQLRTPFALAYGSTETRQAHWLRLAGDQGWGEEAIPPYYGVHDIEKEVYWMAQAQRVDPFPDNIAEIAAWVGESGPASARCALDMALHDRIALRRGLPLYQALGLPKPPRLVTSFTLSIAAPDEMARQAAAAVGFSVLKVKMGSNNDLSRLMAVREARPREVARRRKRRLDARGGSAMAARSGVV